MRRTWHHGHSLGVGVLVGLGLTYRPWLVFAAGVMVGLLLTFAVRGARRLGSALEGVTARLAPRR